MPIHRINRINSLLSVVVRIITNARAIFGSRAVLQFTQMRQTDCVCIKSVANPFVFVFASSSRRYFCCWHFYDRPELATVYLSVCPLHNMVITFDSTHRSATRMIKLRMRWMRRLRVHFYARQMTVGRRQVNRSHCRYAMSTHAAFFQFSVRFILHSKFRLIIKRLRECAHHSRVLTDGDFRWHFGRNDGRPKADMVAVRARACVSWCILIVLWLFKLLKR